MNLLLFVALLSSCCGYALWRGGAPERIGAGLQIAAFATGFPVRLLVDQQGYARLAAGMMAVDWMLFAALVVLAWRSTRFWPLWIAAWQAAALTGHLAKFIDPGMLPTGYAVQAQAWAYPMLLATAAGAWRHRRRVLAGRADPAWKPASDPIARASRPAAAISRTALRR